MNIGIIEPIDDVLVHIVHIVLVFTQFVGDLLPLYLNARTHTRVRALEGETCLTMSTSRSIVYSPPCYCITSLYLSLVANALSLQYLLLVVV